MQRLDARGVGLLLGLLTAAAFVVNTVYWAVAGQLHMAMLVPTLGLAGLLVAYPFLLGWNPLDTMPGMRSCSACGTLWSPQMDRTPFCPACGGKATPA